MIRWESFRAVTVLIFLRILSQDIHAQSGVWTWMHGSSTLNSPGNFGTQGIFSPANDPPALYEACEWTDANGNFWLFGGSDGTVPYNTLWEYNVSLGQWAWISGSNVANGAAVYGTMGVPSIVNTPGVRAFGTMTWTDNNGNLWLFGGSTNDANGLNQLHNELWRFNPSTLEWTWVRGYTTEALSMGTYGTQGVPSPLNDPPGRNESACTWTDSQGDLWMYGGTSTFLTNYFGDLWRYNIASDMWTFMGGSTGYNASPVYGTIGTEAPGNYPGARSVYARCVEQGNYFYLFGGGGNGFSNDLWRYNVATGNWMCVLASTGANYPEPEACEFYEDSKPVHGFEARTSWGDSCGFWIFGNDHENTMWHFQFGADGFAVINTSAPVDYGSMGIPAPSNSPPGRFGGIPWKDQNGDLWMFGGTTSGGNRNDLWKFTISNSCRCSATEVPVPPLPPPADSSFVSANVFTPNHDGMNDELTFGPLKENERVSLYDRWGVEVYSFSAAHLSWDGTYKGRDCAEGVYYFIHVDDAGIPLEKGFVELIR